MGDKELTDDPIEMKAPLVEMSQGSSWSIWWGQLQRRGSTAMPGGRQETRVNAAHLGSARLVLSSSPTAGGWPGQGWSGAS